MTIFWVLKRIAICVIITADAKIIVSICAQGNIAKPPELALWGFLLLIR